MKPEEKHKVISPEYGEMLLNSNPNNRTASPRHVNRVANGMEALKAARAEIGDMRGGWSDEHIIAVEIGPDGEEILRQGNSRVAALRKRGWPQEEVKINYYACGTYPLIQASLDNISRANSLRNTLRMTYGIVCDDLYYSATMALVSSALAIGSSLITEKQWRATEEATRDLLKKFVHESRSKGNPSFITAGFIIFAVLFLKTQAEIDLHEDEKERIRTKFPERNNIFEKKLVEYADIGSGLNMTTASWVVAYSLYRQHIQKRDTPTELRDFITMPPAEWANGEDEKKRKRYSAIVSNQKKFHDFIAKYRTELARRIGLAPE